MPSLFLKFDPQRGKMCFQDAALLDSIREMDGTFTGRKITDPNLIEYSYKEYEIVYLIELREVLFRFIDPVLGKKIKTTVTEGRPDFTRIPIGKNGVGNTYLNGAVRLIIDTRK